MLVLSLSHIYIIFTPRSGKILSRDVYLSKCLCSLYNSLHIFLPEIIICLALGKIVIQNLMQG